MKDEESEIWIRCVVSELDSFIGSLVKVGGPPRTLNKTRKRIQQPCPNNGNHNDSILRSSMNSLNHVGTESIGL